MNVIIAYLETMFSPYPQTPRLLEAKRELQAMMEDAYNGLIASGNSHNEAVGKVITDFGNLEELAPVLGITGDIAPAPTGGAEPVAGIAGAAPGSAGAAGFAGAADGAPPAPAPQEPPVTMEEAQGFAEAHHRTRFRLSAAVAVFVVAAAPLLVLPTAAEAGYLSIGQNAAAVLGLVLLFALVAVGVVMIIGLSREFAPYSRLRDGRFSRNPVVTSWAEDLAQQHERRRIVAMQLAVVCWVLSPAPLLLLTLLTQGSPAQGLWSTIGVVLTLVMVAIGLLILLPATWARTVADALSRGGRRSGGAEDDSEHSIVGVIAAFYWPLLTAIFLAWSFIGNAWDRSWIIWPIGAVLFGAIAAGGGAMESYRKNRR